MFRKQTQPNLIVGLDIGSSAVRVAVGQSLPSSERGAALQLLGAVEVPGAGVHKGVVRSIEEVVSSVSNALEEAERVVGVPIDHVWLGVTGTHILSHASKGVVAVAKTDGEIAPEDVNRVVEAAEHVSPPLNYDVLHVIPRRFAVDGQAGIKDPVGMTGIRLEVDTQIIYGLTTYLKNLQKAVYRTGVDIHDLVVSIFAIGELVTTARQRELGAAVVDIGGSTTSLLVYEEGDILHTAVLPIGSDYVTNDLALGLRTSIDIADRMKREYGDAVIDLKNKKEIIDLLDMGADRSEAVSRHYVSQIVNARVVEILEKVNAELAHIKRAGMLPCGVIITGGGAKIVGLIDTAKATLRLPAALGYPLRLTSATDKLTDVGFSTAIGLVNWGAQMNRTAAPRSQSDWRKAPGTIIEQGKKWLRLLIP